ncbi:hypothetical protein D3C77_352110 [compost metagenome]
MNVAVNRVRSAVCCDVQTGSGSSGQFQHVLVVTEHLKMEGIRAVHHATLSNDILAPYFGPFHDGRVQSVAKVHIQGIENNTAAVSAPNGGFMLQQYIAVIGFPVVVQWKRITLFQA